MNAVRTPTATRIGRLGVVFGVALAVVMVHLWFVMIAQHETWARRSHENRWSFKSVPSQRGALRDRFGEVLAHDEPTTELGVHYVRFRTRHPVGAAVHGATTWVRLQPRRDGTTFDYLDGALGPAAAARELLAMPATALQPRVLPKNVTGELAAAVTTVLSACSGMTRSQSFAAVRAAGRRGDGTAVGDVLPVPRAKLLAAFDASLAALQRLDRDVRASQMARRGSAWSPDTDIGLIDTLEFLRQASLAGARVTWRENGVERTGSKLEEVRRIFAPHVPFDVAAELRVAATNFAGIDVLPSVRRVRAVQPETTLHVLLGNVVGVDRSLPERSSPPRRPADAAGAAGDANAAAAADAAAAPSPRDAAFGRLLARERPEHWFEELESPEPDAGDPDAGDDERERLQREARDYFARELLLRERRGVTGFEAAFDDALMGRVGVRLVEHDSRRRERLLWSHLRVEAGEDVTLSIDLDLQLATEAATTAAWQRQLHGTAADRQKTEAAIALIDARTGDVLAYAGAPIVSPAAVDVPGIVWQGNGALGSVVKPFVLIEQLRAQALGLPHLPLQDVQACTGHFPFGGVRLTCSHQHWDAGRDPTEALAESCNLFFYQCGVGLGEAGVERALQRFGLAKTPADDALAACWQPVVPGLRAAAPTWADARHTLLPNRAIGYGVAASPLHVARAYAALATGALPTLGLSTVPRPHVALDDVAGEIAATWAGLERCVATGTADDLPLLRELGVHAKTGTAEVGVGGQNNAWFAGYLPPLGDAGVQLCFCAVVYWVPDGEHGADAAGQLVVDVLEAMRASPELHTRYLAPESGR